VNDRCERCAFDRADPVADDDLVEIVERCATRDCLVTATEHALFERLRGSSRQLRAARNLAGKRAHELGDMRRGASQNEERLRRLELAHQASTVELETKSRTLAMISAIASAANAALAIEETLHLFLRPLCEGLQMTCGIAVVGREYGMHYVSRRNDLPALGEAFAAFAASGWAEMLGGLVEPSWLTLDHPAWRGEWRARARDAGLLRALLFPVIVDGEHVGGAVLFGEGVRPAPQAHESEVAAAFAALVSQAGRVHARVGTAAANERARRAAEGASQAKSDFVSNMSHELRTPLNAILGYGELLGELLEDEGLAEAAEIAKKINRAGRHLIGLINNILDLSKIEAGKMEVSHDVVDPGAMLRDVVDTITPVALAQSDRLIPRVDWDDLPLISDELKLRQILFNLIGNAVKFTRDGTITVTLAARREQTGERWLRLCVEDTGVGMTDEQLARIFDPFTQAEATTAARYGGTGLGLTLCRRLAALLGGTIGATSRPGVGTRFVVDLPAPTGEGTS
jgi:signal transduction histidine kinase